MNKLTKQKMYLKSSDVNLILALSTMTLSISANVFNTYNKYRKYKLKDIKITPETKRNYNYINIKQIENIEYSKIVKEFSYKMIEKFPKENLTNLYNNINNIKINCKKTLRIDNTIYAGSYSTKKNKITIATEDYLSTITHELLHMSSSKYINNIIYSGFSQIYKHINIGTGITEGYTELLNKRYFNSQDNCYHVESHIAKIIEEIIGQEKMENLYFNANLNGLNEELKKYSTTKEILEFIKNTDYLSDNTTVNLSPIQNKILDQKINKIIEFLLTTYIKKIISNKEKVTSDKFASLLCTFVKKEKLFFAITEKDITKYIDEILQEEKSKERIRRTT